MKNEIIREITQQMLPYLDNMGLEQLQKVLKVTLQNYEIIKFENHSEQNYSNLNFMELFLSAKRVEGCSEKTLKYAIMENITEFMKELGDGYIDVSNKNI